MRGAPVATRLENRRAVESARFEAAIRATSPRVEDRISLPPGKTRSARTRRAEALVSRTRGDAALLEALRADYVQRLHHASNDFEATEGLRIIEAALAMIPRPEWSWQRRERKRRERRSQRSSS
jgi:hypothetical protein